MKAAAAFLALAISTGAYASAISETLTLDTSTLPASLAPYNLQLVLTGGSGNTAAFANFDFGGGMGAFSAPGASGVVVTTSPATITLTDASAGSGNFGPEYDLSFTPGTRLSFTLMTGNIAPPAGSGPDEIDIALADNSGAPFATTDPTSGNSLYRLLLTGDADTPAFYSGLDPNFTGQFTVSAGPNGGGTTGGGGTSGGGGSTGGGGTSGGGGGGAVGTSPEPSTLWLAFSGLLLCPWLMRRRVAQSKN